MIVIEKNQLNFIYLNLPGTLGYDSTVPQYGVYYLEFIDDSTGESLVTVNNAATEVDYTDRYTVFQLLEGVDDPTWRSLILSGTNKHYHFKLWWKNEPTMPSVAPIIIPSGARMMLEETVWTEGINNITDSVYQ